MTVLRRKRVIEILLILILASVAGFLLLGGFRREDPSQRYRLARVERGNISSVVTATGTINPVVTVLVGSQISGTIKALYADFNSRVREGEIIARIDPSLFEAQVEQARANVAAEQANLANAQANLLNIEANLAKAEVAVSDAKKTLDRNIQLRKMNAIAQAALDTSQANYESALAQREAVKAQLQVAKAQIESARAQVEKAKAALKIAETNLRYTVIRSPVNGIVISRNVDVGQTVAASLQAPTLFTIAKDLTEMQVDTNFSEADIGRIEVGQEATFTVDAFPERIFRGKVSEIRNAPQTIQNVVTYDVVIKVENKDLKLKPGMTANVSITVASRSNVLKIPNAALRFQPQDAKAVEMAPEKKEKGAKTEERERSSSGEKETGERRGRSLVASITEGLDLTPAQREKVEAVLKEARQEIRTIRETLAPEEARTRIQSLIRQKIMGILTEEQRSKLAESTSSTNRGTAGRVWILSPDGRPVPVRVVVGITDGMYSELVSGNLKEGTELIVEELSKGKTQSRGTPSPFMPPVPRR